MLHLKDAVIPPPRHGLCDRAARETLLTEVTIGSHIGFGRLNLASGRWGTGRRHAVCNVRDVCSNHSGRGAVLTKALFRV